MYLMVTDETNRQPSSDVSFFIYGGLILDVNKLPELDSAICDIRLKAGYKSQDEFKFDTRSRPCHVSQDNCNEAKRAVIELCSKLGCKFIVHIILHDIIARQNLNQQVQWAADYVIGRFNQYLEEAQGYGICVVDNLPITAQFKYLSDKFTAGLALDSGTVMRLDRIKMFAASCINASHANSAMDIVLGSFRYCINDPKNREAAKSMIGKVSDLLWGEKVGDVYKVIGKGVIVRPDLRSIRKEDYKKRYEALFENIDKLLSE